MARRVYRVLLILALAALAGVTGWQVWSLDRTRTQQRDAAELLQRDALRVQQALLDLRASQRAYLSPGQGIAAWKPRVDAHIAALREHFNALREQASASSSPFAAAAAQADDEAMDALVAARYLETRIADHVKEGRLQHAADLMYADGVRGSLMLERAAQAAFTAHEQDLQFGRTRVQWTEGALLALAAAIGMVLALLVMPARRAQAGAAEGVDAEGAAAERGTGDAAVAAAAGRTTGMSGRPRSEPAIQSLGLASDRRSATASAGAAGASAAGGASIPAAAARGGSKATGTGRLAPAIAAAGPSSPASPPPAITMAHDLPLHPPAPVIPMASAAGRTAPGTGTAAALAVHSVSEASPRFATPKEPAAAAVNGRVVDAEGLLAAAAELTVSVARVGDIDGLKPVMARLAEHLDAVGLIVWLEDASTQRLTPIVTHGYPAETLAHLPPIDLDADNATARAWRLAELQIVSGRGSDPGAIVVPMPSSAGCVGVVAAEVRHGREHDPATLALARILAAQLAMLTGQRG